MGGNTDTFVADAPHEEHAFLAFLRDTRHGCRDLWRHKRTGGQKSQQTRLEAETVGEIRQLLDIACFDQGTKEAMGGDTVNAKALTNISNSSACRRTLRQESQQHEYTMKVGRFALPGFSFLCDWHHPSRFRTGHTIAG